MSFASGLPAQADVLGALILRETRTRFGANQLGYLWAFIEPALWTLTFYAMFQVAQREAPLGMSIVGFVVTGLLPFQMFRETASRAQSAIDGNKALLFYPQVRPLDLVLARTGLEAATLTTVLIVLLGFDALVLGSAPVDDPLKLLCALCLATLLGAGLGLTVSGLSLYSTAVNRLVGPVLRPLFWISGIFFTANSLPTQIRELLLFNPVLHVIELARDALTGNYAAAHAEPGYVGMWIAAFWFLGLTLERVSRRKLEVT